MIRGLVDGGLAWVDASVRLPALSEQPGDISFLIDTGATVTVLMPADLRRLGIEPEGLFPDIRAVRVPGFGGDIKMILTGGMLRFSDAADRAAFSMPIGIVEPSTASYELPSVLGMGFLRHFRLTISVAEDRVELERIQ